MHVASACEGLFHTSGATLSAEPPSESDPHDLKQSCSCRRLEVRILSANRRTVGDRSGGDPGVHYLHRLADCLQPHPQPGQLVSDGLIDHQRRCDLPRGLQGAETTCHLLVTACGEDAVAKLGDGDYADGNLVRESAEGPLLLARDEDRGIQNRLQTRRSPYSSSVVSGNALV